MHPWLHFKTITRHKLLVMHYCFRAGLYKQGLLHDLSKYEPVEFLVGCKYYQGDRSPNNAEREETGLSKSWMHMQTTLPVAFSAAFLIESTSILVLPVPFLPGIKLII